MRKKLLIVAAWIASLVLVAAGTSAYERHRILGGDPLPAMGYIPSDDVRIIAKKADGTWSQVKISKQR